MQKYYFLRKCKANLLFFASEEGEIKKSSLSVWRDWISQYDNVSVVW